MKTLRNLHTRRLADIDLSRDGEALADLLAEAETAGSAAAIRVRTRDGRTNFLPLPMSLPADAGTPPRDATEAIRSALAHHGFSRGVQSEGFDAEILVRDPFSTAADRMRQFRDRNDERVFRDGGQREDHSDPTHEISAESGFHPRKNSAGKELGTDETPMEKDDTDGGDLLARARSHRGCSHSSFLHQPMFFRPTGSPVDLIDLYRNASDGRTADDASVFLVLNGPSFDEGQRSLLANRPGIVTFAVNNGGHAFRPDLWTCVDAPTRFMPSIWDDGRILKFVPMAHFEKDRGGGRRVADAPNTVGYRRNDAFDPDGWLWEGTINWGNHKSRGGGRSVMLVALRIAFLLGFRRVYLVGCDFRMDEDAKYWFPEDRTAAAIRNNRKSYRRMTEYFEELLPRLKAAGLEVWNCNPESGLRVFPFADLETAVKRAEVDVSGSTQGMYAAA